MIIRPGVGRDLDIVTSWLAAAGLPSADLTDAHMEHFLIAVGNESPVGMVGLEKFEDSGLLRSLVVDSASRGGGVGRQLVAALEVKASSQGVAQLWLLTIDADAYFAALGYEVIKRDAAPECIRQTTEFSKLCPGDAVLMRKTL